MSFILSKLFGFGSRLSPLERIILDGVRGELDGVVVRYWDMQVKAINKIQRLPNGIEVDFYRMKNGGPSFDDSLSFPNKKKELKVAEINIKIPNVNGILVAEVWCVKGFLSSIEYNTNPVYFEEYASTESQPKFALGFNIINDLSACAN